ncbi:unnamed protein product [Durusdinium trenchii]|uniref:Uncharacterized protein n=1 Tax=Durusdinium trenchii TaxID=1381693 RepID=A0ABP0S4W7_9DINO
MAFAKKPRTTGIELPKMPGDSPALTQRTGSMGSLAASRKRLPTNAPKVFVITGNPESANLDVVRQELLTRGFTEGAVGEAEDFLLKWGPRSKVDWRSLAPPQLVNHYENDAALTTKSGLKEPIQRDRTAVISWLEAAEEAGAADLGRLLSLELQLDEPACSANECEDPWVQDPKAQPELHLQARSVGVASIPGIVLS